MAGENLTMGGNEYSEILDEEFNRYIEMSQNLMKSLKKPEDIDICLKYIQKCLSLNAPSIEVKNSRNDFFKYFLKMLESAVITQPEIYNTWFQPKAEKVEKVEKFEQEKPEQEKPEKEKLSSYMSPDKRTYIAAKTIPGYGVLIYLAVSYNPELGWQKYGFKSYKF